mgnify:CR=1 FL=1
MKLFSFILAFLCLFSSAVQAQIEHYSFDKAHTQILFFVDHLGFSMSQGKFHDYEGHFVFDRTVPENSSVSVTISAGSIDMDHEKWNTHMRSQDFFAAGHFPDITFESTEITVTGDKTAKITGDLTMRGKTNAVTLDTRFNRSAKHPFSGDYVAGFSATARLDRTQWGMDYGVPQIGKDVRIRLEVEGIRTESSHKQERTAN